jgi:predicted metal-binding membrane protein
MSTVAGNSGCVITTNTKAESAVFHLWAVGVFAASVLATIYFCRSMSGEMAMPGGWTMSMAWMRMPGQSWAAAFLMFQAMWLAMMVAMMGPCVFPPLIQYRRTSSNLDAARLAGGYFLVYLIMGVVIYPPGIWLAIAAMRWPNVSRIVPFFSAAALITAGAFQWTPWKSRHLTNCRDPLACCAGIGGPPDASACARGFHWGLSCATCCAGIMLCLFVLGMMNPYVILGLTVVITLERLLPRPEPVTWISGLAAMATGLAQLARYRG